MTDQLMGIDYFSLSTLMKDDDKVFDLKYRYAVPEGATGEAYDNDAAFAAYGRFVELLASIYREGFCLQMSKQTRLRLSQQLGLALPAFDAFIETCVEVGLFDSSLWNAERVLTSHGIQTRYFHAVKRRKGSLPTDLKPFILLGSNECEQDADTEGSATSDDARTVQTPCEHDANTLHLAGYVVAFGGARRCCLGYNDPRCNRGKGTTMAQEYARIFAALDGASTQEAVAQRAVTLAADNHAKLMFGHVIDSVPYEASGVDFEALCAEGKKRIEADLADVLAAARQNPDIPSVEVSVHAGRIADTLEHELIEPFEPNLVVCGERGLSNIKYVFVGSVSTYLIRNLRCDILVVKEN